jgi:hypothetical protein
MEVSIACSARDALPCQKARSLSLKPAWQATGILSRPPFNHHWVLPDVDGKLHCLDQFEVPNTSADDASRSPNHWAGIDIRVLTTFTW